MDAPQRMAEMQRTLDDLAEQARQAIAESKRLLAQSEVIKRQNPRYNPPDSN